ncbi:hypothetical protein JCM11641_001120 [Rhodosporidiobolus odoratus]
MSTPSIQLNTQPRPLIDRRRTASRERGVLGRPTSTGGGGGGLASPVGSPPTPNSPLQGILKRKAHPADQSDRGTRGTSEGTTAGGGGQGGEGSSGPVERSLSNLSLSTNTTSTNTTGGGGGADSETTAFSPATASTSTSSARSSLDAPPPVATSVSMSMSGPTTTTNQSHQSQFRRRVGFDTFSAGGELEGKAKATGGGTGVSYSFTLAAKSSEYCRTRWSRTFLVATDLNEYSVNATDWLLTSLLEDNDEVVVLRVIEPNSSAHKAWEASMEEAREEAEGVLEYLMRKNGEEKQISLIVEFAIGPIEETIHRMIEIHKPDSLVVGTRGRPDSLFKSAFMGSISRWAVARSPIPVVVVRPDDKVREALSRRLQDSKRGRSYVSLLSSDEQARLAVPSQDSILATGALLERTVTAPEADAADGAKKIEFASGTKGGEKGKKKDKGKEFKRFGTFS